MALLVPNSILIAITPEISTFPQEQGIRKDQGGHPQAQWGHWNIMSFV